MQILLRLPRPLFGRICGTEWFVEAGARVPATPIDDPMTPAARALYAVT